MIRFPVPPTPPMPMLVVPMLLSLPLVLGSASPGPADASGDAGQARAPMVVTSDTASYCEALSERIGARGALPPAVCTLRREGDALCARGEVRTGIRRLRRALMALEAEGSDQAGGVSGCR